MSGRCARCLPGSSPRSSTPIGSDAPHPPSPRAGSPLSPLARGEGNVTALPRPACGERVGVRGLLASGLLAVALSIPVSAETISEPLALLQGLDKITARVSKFEAPV